MEALKEALEYAVGLSIEAEKTQVLQIEGHTYANKSLKRYDIAPAADPLQAHTLTAMMDYIGACSHEFPRQMIIHIDGPERVSLLSGLDGDRKRETLFVSDANISGFRFNQWYDQESFMLSLQANFEVNDDLRAVMKLAGNIEKKNEQTFTDDGCTQVATMTVGVATKADAIVPNPVSLIPYRTFLEVEQPESKFVFRIGDKEEPAFKIVEADGGLWQNQAVSSIKVYLTKRLTEMGDRISKSVVVIG